MSRRIVSVPRGPEPGLLKRLRKAVAISGLTADLSALDQEEQTLVVTDRLAVTTVRYLTSIDPATGQRLAEELRAMANPEEYELLMQSRGYTFYHVVQFLYEYAEHYADIPDREYFCAGMGRGGGGLAVEPHKEVISLIRLLITALPEAHAHDRREIGVLMQTLGPLMLGQIFTAGLFRIEVAPQGEDGLQIALQYADLDRVAACCKALGLQGDIGAFFLNSALHIQGTVQLGWDTFAEDAARAIRMETLIEDRDRTTQAEISKICSCNWTVTWTPDVRLRRLHDDEEIMALARTVYEALHRKDLEYHLERIKSLEMQVQALEEGGRFHELIGSSRQMRRVYQMIQQVAESDLTVLIRGESGTGKDLVARAIHEISTRRERPFVAVNCAAFSETLLESELFGHEKGAFTGADRTKPGRFELADGGTLFLDEVGDIPLTTQVKLLRALETRAFERVGGTQTIQADVRIVGATNRDLEGLIADGVFREDFYFRLNVIPIHVPPLREHREDIPQLAQHFLLRASQHTSERHGFSRGAMERLVNHAWPGNIRELQNVIERAAVVYARGVTLTESDVMQALGIQAMGGPSHPLNLRQQEVLQTIQNERGGTVDDLLDAVAPVIEGAGRSRRTLQNDLRKLTEMGYVIWQKRGSARYYMATEEGEELLQAMQE